MKHLTSQLHPIKCDWRSVGVQLDISDGSLKSLENDTRYNDTMSCKCIARVLTVVY